MFRLMLGQFTMVANAWTDGDAFGNYAGDFTLVGVILHLSAAPEEPSNQGRGSMSKDWRL